MVSALDGKRVVVTRSASQSAALCERLCSLGAVPICFPTIRLAALPAPELDETLVNLDQYEWLLFTSTNAVRFFFARLSSLQAKGSLPRIAAVGPVTEEAMRVQGYRPEAIPTVYTGDALAACLGDLDGKQVLLPRAKQGRPEVVNTLLSLGAVVNDIALYETVIAELSPEALAEIDAGVDVLTFTSPSTAINFYRLVDRALVASAIIACIGPTTADAVRELGIDVDVIPSSYTVDDMIDALLTYCGQSSPPQAPIQEGVADHVTHRG